jgi:uncharacterized small protein (DUF1192 family)
MRPITSGAEEITITPTISPIEPPVAALAILKDPNLFERIAIQESDKCVVGEHDTRRALFLCMQGGRLVANAKLTSYNAMVNDGTGVGKDYVVSSMFDLLPKEYAVKKTRITENVLTYWHNANTEPTWTWDGKVFYVEDISEKTLNCEVFKVFSSSGSSATVLIKQTPVDIEVRGKPVLIITAAKSHPSEENLRRFPILSLDSGINQTKAIIKRRAAFAASGITPEYDAELVAAQRYLKRVYVKVVFAPMIAAYFCERPDLGVIMRTHTDRFFDYIKAAAAIHQYQRVIDSEGYLLASEVDYEIARSVLLKTTTNSRMIPLTKDDSRILEIIAKFTKDSPDAEGYSVGELEERITFLSDKWLRERLDFLADQRFLKKGRKIAETGRKVATYSVVPDSSITVPTYKELQDFYKYYKDTIATNTTITTITEAKNTPKTEKEGLIEVIEVIEQGNRKSNDAPEGMELYCQACFKPKRCTKVKDRWLCVACAQKEAI